MSPHAHNRQVNSQSARDTVHIGWPGRKAEIDTFFRNRLRLSQLRLLVALSDVGQVKKVAAMLNISSPAVSKQIAEIENSLGSPLVVRVGNHVEFTALGNLMATRSRELLQHLEKTHAEVNDLCSGMTGSVGIGVVHSVGTIFLPHLVKSLKAHAPGVAMRIYEFRFEHLAPLLKSGVVDFVLARETAHPLSDGFSELALMSDPVVIVCGSEHRARWPVALEWSDLRGTPWIMPMADAKPLVTHLYALLQKNGLTLPPDSIESSSTTTVVGLLQIYPFVAAMPLSYAQAFVRSNRVSVLPLSTQGILGTINAVWRKDSTDPIVTLLVEAAKSLARVQ